jgi:hypothetical protein
LESASKTEPDYVRPNHFHELWFFEWALGGTSGKFLKKTEVRENDWDAHNLAQFSMLIPNMLLVLALRLTFWLKIC